MIKSIALITIGLLATPALAAPIDGTWLVDVGTAKLSQKPEVRTLSGGIYRCSTCTPAFAIPADGRFHAIKGDPYGTESSVKVIDAKSVAFEDRQRGKLVSSSMYRVSADGRTVTWSGKRISGNGTVTDSEGTEIRLAPGPKGAHLVSGSWRNGKLVSVDAKALTISFKDTGARFQSVQPTGYRIDAPIGGPAVAIGGDPSGEMVAVRRADPSTYLLIYSLGGKQMSTLNLHLGDSSTMTATSVDTRSGRVTRYTAKKQ